MCLITSSPTIHFQNLESCSRFEFYLLFIPPEGVLVSYSQSCKDTKCWMICAWQLPCHLEGIFVPYFIQGLFISVDHTISKLYVEIPHLSVLNPVHFISPKLILRKGNLHSVPLQHLISPLPCFHYLSLTATKEKQDVCLALI